MGKQPSTNVLFALKNILTVNKDKLPLVIDHRSSNRINSTGDMLEYYIKDAFTGSSYDLGMTDQKMNVYQKYFSYLGNSNNPPDFIIKQGPAVEVKKIESTSTNSLALNSSYPKDYLHVDDPRINNQCRICEDEGWTKKDMIYAIGNVIDSQLHSLWFIYGDCFCASRDTYEKIANTIKSEVSIIPDVEFSETKELGRVNKVDPLGITYLRIRGMWGIDHPSAVFKNIMPTMPSPFNVYTLMTRKTYEELENKPDLSAFITNKQLEINNVKIPNPNNPAKTLEAVFITAFL